MTDEGMSKIVKTIANITFPFIMIFGLYIIAHGHLTPGGGFQGGAIVASALAMLLIAYGSSWAFNKAKKKNLSILESIGAVAFIGLALLGLIFGAVFFNNFLTGENILFGEIPEYLSTDANINTGGMIPWMNFAVGIKVIAGLFGIVLFMAYATRKKNPEGKK